MAPKDSNGWKNYEKLVMSELERHGQALDRINKKFDELREQIILLPYNCPYKNEIRSNTKKIVYWSGAVAVIVVIVSYILPVAIGKLLS